MKKNIEMLKKNNFIISKEEKIQSVNTIYVDDVNKKFAIQVGKKGKLKIYNYKDLGQYELNEDGNSVLQGKGIATIVGGMAFGIFGAMAGAVGKRANTNICTSMVVRIMVNDLDEPQIVIPFITNKTKKGKMMYNISLAEAKKLISILSYIERAAI